MEKNLQDSRDQYGGEEEEGENQKVSKIYDGLAQCYHQMKEFDQALYFFEMAISEEPDSTDFLMNRGQCFYD